MTISQVVVLFTSGAMAMDGAGNYQKQANFLFNTLIYVLGFPLYPIIGMEESLNSVLFDKAVIVKFLLNCLVQWMIIEFLVSKFRKP